MQQVRAQSNLGRLYEGSGKVSEALAMYEAALKMCRELGLAAEEAQTLNSLMFARWRAGKFQEALGTVDELRPLLEVLRKGGNLPGLGHTLGSLGLILLLVSRGAEQGNLLGVTPVHDQALKAQEAALKLYRQLHDRRNEADVLAYIGVTRAAMGRDTETLDALKSALELDEQLGQPAMMPACWHHIGHIYRRRQQWDQAATAYRKSIECIEFLRTEAKEYSLQTALFQRFTSPYDSTYLALATCLLELRAGSEEVFAFSERAKARALVDLLGGGKIHVLKAMTGAERQEEQARDGTLTGLTTQLSRLASSGDQDAKLRQELQHKLETCRAEYEAFRRRLFLAHPELQTQRARFEPVSLKDLNRTLFAREPNLCILSYLLGNEETWLYVLTRGKNADSPATVKVHRLPLELRELREALEGFRRWCQQPSARFQFDSHQL